MSLTLNEQSALQPLVPESWGIQVWYPAQGSPPPESRQSLFHDFYTGPADTISFFTSYLRGVQTHSYRQAAIASDGPFPVIFFNHGLFTSVDQNVLLMKHLVSHGYVVIAIGHPYQSLKVDLPNSGQVMFHPEYPADVGFSQQEVSDGGIGEALGRITGTSASELTASLYRVLVCSNLGGGHAVSRWAH